MKIPMYRFENKVIPVSTFLNYEFKVHSGLDKEDFELDYGLLERMLFNVDIWSHGTCNIRGIINIEKDTFEILDKQTLSIVETLIRFIILDDLKLEDLGVLTELNGLTFSELENRFKRRINESYINVCYVEEWGNNSFDKDSLAKFFK